MFIADLLALNPYWVAFTCLGSYPTGQRVSLALACVLKDEARRAPFGWQKNKTRRHASSPARSGARTKSPWTRSSTDAPGSRGQTVGQGEERGTQVFVKQMFGSPGLLTDLLSGQHTSNLLDRHSTEVPTKSCCLPAQQVILSAFQLDAEGFHAAVPLEILSLGRSY